MIVSLVISLVRNFKELGNIFYLCQCVLTFDQFVCMGDQMSRVCFPLKI